MSQNPRMTSNAALTDVPILGDLQASYSLEAATSASYASEYNIYSGLDNLCTKQHYTRYDLMKHVRWNLEAGAVPSRRLPTLDSRPSETCKSLHRVCWEEHVNE